MALTQAELQQIEHDLVHGNNMTQQYALSDIEKELMHQEAAGNYITCLNPALRSKVGDYTKDQEFKFR